MRLQSWLGSAFVICTCLMWAPAQAQQASPAQDQIHERKAPQYDLFGEPEFFIRRRLTNSPKPEYPKAAQEAGVQGDVLAFVWFDKEGRLVEAKALVSPDESLSRAVVEALKEWRMKAYTPYNPEANFWSEIRFIFSLKDGKAEVSNAPEAEQRKVSAEFQQERNRRQANAAN
jgi:TonB family protein